MPLRAQSPRLSGRLVTEDQIKAVFNEDRHYGDAVLQKLLEALKITVSHRHYEASDLVERAVYKFRLSERERLQDAVMSAYRED